MRVRNSAMYAWNTPHAPGCMPPCPSVLAGCQNAMVCIEFVESFLASKFGTSPHDDKDLVKVATSSSLCLVGVDATNATTSSRITDTLRMRFERRVDNLVLVLELQFNRTASSVIQFVHQRPRPGVWSLSQKPSRILYDQDFIFQQVTRRIKNSGPCHYPEHPNSNTISLAPHPISNTIPTFSLSSPPPPPPHYHP
jgi:hypothetical protein